MKSSYSLKWQLIRRLVGVQAAMFAAAVVLLLALLWAGGLLLDKGAEFAITSIEQSITRSADGRLQLRPTEQLRELQNDHPDLWFVVRDEQGEMLVQGTVPVAFQRLQQSLAVMSDLGQANLWSKPGTNEPDAHLRRLTTAAGVVYLLIDTERSLSFREFLVTILWVTLIFSVPVVLLMSAISFFGTSMVVRGAFHQVGEIVDQAERINVDERRVRLPLTSAPQEIMPLLVAINAALGRLDEGYERQSRFLADAAHELRTPITILQTQLESLTDDEIVGDAAKPATKEDLHRNLARLATMAEQLLDLQRLEQGAVFNEVDLVAVAMSVAADLAPLAIAAGRELSVVHEEANAFIHGDAPALERALTNLVQNAIEHARRQISIRVGPMCYEVEDDGPGIPASERERVFEPFHRLHAATSGAGLGLHLVRQIVHRHGGRIEVHDASLGGARMRVTFAAASGALIGTRLSQG